jgi:hypothetical protein
MDPTTPSLEGALRARAAAEAEDAFWRDHYTSYLERYPDQFVAVADGKVITASSDLSHVVGVLKGKGVDVRRAWVRYIAATPRHLAL